MSQLILAKAEYDVKMRKTRRELFLDRIKGLIPWQRFEQQLAKKYSTGTVGRKTYPLSVMFRVHIMKLIYNLSDPAMEDSLYETESMRRFSGRRLSEQIPDETTTLNFRRFIERHKFGKRLFESVLEHLDQQGLKLQEGSIISAPTSTKNKSGTRDPEMHQTKKGCEWHFGIKMHIGVDGSLGLIQPINQSPMGVQPALRHR